MAQNDRIQKRSITVKEVSGGDEPEEYNSFPNTGVKINPVLIAIGDFPVTLEYSPWDWFSVETGLGVTFKNFMDPHQPTVSEANVKSSPGYSFMFSAKFFPFEDALDDGGYYALQYDRRQYVQEYSIPSVEGTLESKTIVESFNLVYGWQYFITKVLYLDSYVGIGLKRDKGVYVREFNSNGVTGYATFETVYDSGVSGFESISVPFGIKLGYLF